MGKIERLSGRRIVLYYAWSRPAEVGAPLGVIENRFPTLFESRRMAYPRFEEFSDPGSFDQSVAGFLDHIMKQNFAVFVSYAQALTSHRVVEAERVDDSGKLTALTSDILGAADTLIVISFDSLRSGQEATAGEVAVIRKFLENPDHAVFVCPHHDIGDVPEVSHDQRLELQQAQFLHHGDKTIPPQQRFGGFARSLLAGLGVPVENRFGLHPASDKEGTPAPIQSDKDRDRLNILAGVRNFNLHPHLPHFERLGDAVTKMDVIARQMIDITAPSHPFTRDGRTSFDALLQSRADVFAGSLFVGDATLWSSTAGGLESLKQFWKNVVQRELRL